MPNRIIKESICTSDTIDKLSWFEEVLFYRLIVSCDDYGRYDGRLKIIKGKCFPLRDITDKQIDHALDKLSSVGLVELYEVYGHPYLQIVTWEHHQSIRNFKSKFPAKSDNCNQLKSIEIKSSRNPIQSNPNPIQSESNPNTQKEHEHVPDENKLIAEQVIAYLNQKTGSKYKNIASNIKNITARLGEGYSLDDCKKVIDKKCDEWLDDEKMCKFLKPDTLFRPGHFDTYLNQPTAKRKNISSGIKIELPEYMRKQKETGIQGSSEKATPEQINAALEIQKKMKERKLNK